MGKYVVIAMLLLVLIVIVLFLNTSARPFGESYRSIDELGGPFTLQTKQGSFSLSDIKGKVGILYFGFLNCDDACPTSIGVVRAAYKKLSATQREQVQFIYISVDPERDTDMQLSHFSHRYNDDLIAVTGTEAQIKAVTRQYGVYFDIKDLEGETDGYDVDHSSQFYMLDKTGKLIRTMSHSTTPIELAARLKQMMEEDVESLTEQETASSLVN